jgi:hypothetical protein
VFLFYSVRSGPVRWCSHLANPLVDVLCCATGFGISAFYAPLSIVTLSFLMPSLRLSAVRKRLGFSRLVLYSDVFACLSAVNVVTAPPFDCKWLRRFTSSAFRRFVHMCRWFCSFVLALRFL